MPLEGEELRTTVPEEDEPDEEPEVDVVVEDEDEAVAVCEPEAVEDPPLAEASAVATKGFDELPPVPLPRSRAMLPIVSCWLRDSDLSVESTALPLLMAQIHELLELVGSIVPPLQDRQLSQRTLAVIDPSDELVDPARTLTVAAELPYDGIDWPVPSRGDRVTFPLPSA